MTLEPLSVMTGGVVSTTVTVALETLDAPCESVTVRVTVVVPMEYGPAGICARVMASPLSASKEPSLMDAFAVQVLSAATVTFFDLAVGGMFFELGTDTKKPSSTISPKAVASPTICPNELTM